MSCVQPCSTVTTLFRSQGKELLTITVTDLLERTLVLAKRADDALKNNVTNCNDVQLKLICRITQSDQSRSTFPEMQTYTQGNRNEMQQHMVRTCLAAQAACTAYRTLVSSGRVDMLKLCIITHFSTSLLEAGVESSAAGKLHYHLNGS